MTDDHLLDNVRIRELLEELGRRLSERGIEAPHVCRGRCGDGAGL